MSPGDVVQGAEAVAELVGKVFDAAVRAALAFHPPEALTARLTKAAEERAERLYQDALAAKFPTDEGQ